MSRAAAQKGAAGDACSETHRGFFLKRPRRPRPATTGAAAAGADTHVRAPGDTAHKNMADNVWHTRFGATSPSGAPAAGSAPGGSRAPAARPPLPPGGGLVGAHYNATEARAAAGAEPAACAARGLVHTGPSPAGAGDAQLLPAVDRSEGAYRRSSCALAGAHRATRAGQGGSETAR